MVDELKTHSSDENKDDGDVAFTIGPARRPPGLYRESCEPIDDRQILRLALIASEYGKTTFVDSYGSSVIIGGGPEDSVVLF